MKKSKILLLSSIIATSLAGCGTKEEQFYKNLNVKKVTDYLYEAKLDYDFDYEIAKKNFQQYRQQIGGCSAISIGNLRGRNYDWEYADGTSWVVRTSKKKDRHASIGIASLTGFNNTDAQDGKYHEQLQMLPFTTLDIINDAGIYVNVNVVPYQSLGKWEMRNDDSHIEMCELCGPRIIGDKCSYLDEIIPEFDKYDWYSLGTEEETHFMVTGPRSKNDPTVTTVVFEFVPFNDGGLLHKELCVISNKEEDKVIAPDNLRFYKSSAKNLIMTNFNLWGFDPSLPRADMLGDGIGSVIDKPMGFERFEILNAAGGNKDSVTKQEMQELMERVYYSRAYNLYQNDFWYSEYNLSKQELRLISDEERFPLGDINKLYQGNAESYKLMKDQIEKWHNRDRRIGSSQGLWETLHLSIFDYENASFRVVVREGNIFYDFSLK